MLLRRGRWWQGFGNKKCKWNFYKVKCLYWDGYLPWIMRLFLNCCDSKGQTVPFASLEKKISISLLCVFCWWLSWNTRAAENKVRAQRRCPLLLYFLGHQKKLWTMCLYILSAQYQWTAHRKSLWNWKWSDYTCISGAPLRLTVVAPKALGEPKPIN